jgi:hypothetical protein
MKYFFAQCYQRRDGSYLSLPENIKSIVLIRAASEEDAFLILAEQESVDSEISIVDRWGMNEINEEYYINAGQHVPRLS